MAAVTNARGPMPADPPPRSLPPFPPPPSTPYPSSQLLPQCHLWFMRECSRKQIQDSGWQCRVLCVAKRDTMIQAYCRVLCAAKRGTMIRCNPYPHSKHWTRAHLAKSVKSREEIHREGVDKSVRRGSKNARIALKILFCTPKGICYFGCEFCNDPISSFWVLGGNTESVSQSRS